MALTAAQLCTNAAQVAKCPGYTSQAGQGLNQILGDLCRAWDFELAAKTTYFNFNPGLSALVGNSIYGSGPYPLPTDFLRIKDDKSAFWTLPGTGVVYPLIPCDLSEFYMMVQQAGTQSYPYIIATDMSLGDETTQGDNTPVCYVYAPPSGAYPVTIRYFAQMPDIYMPETSATIPWFPHQGYLHMKLSAYLMGFTDDVRQGEWDKAANELLREYLMMKDNRSNRASTVKLDRRRFGRAYTTLPNTKTVGWVVALALLGGSVLSSLYNKEVQYAHGRAEASAQRIYAGVEA